MSAESLPLGYKLVGIFSIFLQSIAFFAIAYAWLYSKNHRHFVFNADIVKRQCEVAGTEWHAELVRFRRIQSLIRDLDAALAKGEAVILPESAPGEVVLSSRYTYKFKISGTGFSVPILYLEVFDENNKLQDTYIDPTLLRALPVHGPHFREFTRRYLDELENRCAHFETLVSDAQGEGTQVWGIWDFLYFSVVIQTTIGLGDILPNSTLIRKLVILQTVIGYGILIILLNFVLASAH